MKLNFLKPANPPVIKEPPPPPPKETFEETIRRYYLWQISGENIMKADDVRVGNINYTGTIQPWNVITSWKLGYFDGGVIRQMHNWSQTSDPAYLKAASHYLSKMLEEINSGGIDVEPIKEKVIIPIPPVNAPEVDEEITKMAKRLAVKIAEDDGKK